MGNGFRAKMRLSGIESDGLRFPKRRVSALCRQMAFDLAVEDIDESEP
jgi:hypothetical protein